MLQLVAHSVNFLHVGEDHLGIYSVFLDHATHVLSSQKVRDTSKLLSGSESKLIIFHSVLGCVNLESFEVESIGEKVVNECSESKTVGPGLCEVTDLDSVIFTGSALAPDQDGLHLGGEGLLTGDSELKSKTSMSSHSSTCAVWVKPWSGILYFLNESRHILKEQVMEVLLLHILQLEGWPVLSSNHFDVFLIRRSGEV